ncbi:hypothetical protein GW17_00004139 [Ensete ventricosum]|nr:hypothetical protein GW17_00004139 [Ensete ventricosum]
MATLQLPHLNQSLLSSSSASPFAAYARKIPGRHSTRRLLPVASLPSGPAHTTRREFIFETAAAPLALAALAGAPAPARSEEPALSEWERVYLPIDPGVVLLDIAFVSDDMNHGPSLPLRLHSQYLPGFLLGTRQTILETKDGGNTWVPRSISSAEDEDFNYRFNSISFKGKEGWIVGKPAILLYTSDAGESWERIPLSAELPGDMVILKFYSNHVYIKATGEKSAEMVTDEGAIYVTSNRGYNWKAAVQETVSATLNRYKFLYDGCAKPFSEMQELGTVASCLLIVVDNYITEDFEEVPVQSRGFGILDVGYRSKVNIVKSLISGNVVFHYCG